MTITTAAPQLRTTDLERSITFYTQVLGLELAFRHADFYAGIRAGETTIHLKRVDARDPTIAEVSAGGHLHLYLQTDDVATLAARLKAHGVPLVLDVHETAWGTREAVLHDDQGHTLYLGQAL